MAPFGLGSQDLIDIVPAHIIDPKLPLSNVSRSTMPKIPDSRDSPPHLTLQPIPTFEQARTATHRRGRLTRAERRSLDAADPSGPSYGKIREILHKARALQRARKPPIPPPPKSSERPQVTSRPVRSLPMTSTPRVAPTSLSDSERIIRQRLVDAERAVKKLRHNLEETRRKLDEEDDLEIDLVREMLSTDEVVFESEANRHEPHGASAHETRTAAASKSTLSSHYDDRRPPSRSARPDPIIIDITMLDPTPPPSPRP